MQPRADPDRRRGRGHSRVGGQERSGPCRSAVVPISAAIPRAQASMSVRSRKSPPVRGVQAGRAMALGGRQPDVSGRAAASAETRSGAAIGRRCDEDLERVVASRSRLGRADLACPDDRRTRRGEMCGLRWSRVDLAGAVLTLRRSIAQHGGQVWEKDTKPHQQRRVALDPETVVVLTEHWIVVRPGHPLSVSSSSWRPSCSHWRRTAQRTWNRPSGHQRDAAQPPAVQPHRARSAQRRSGGAKASVTPTVEVYGHPSVEDARAVLERVESAGARPS